jgi:hypothetical protein
MLPSVVHKWCLLSLRGTGMDLFDEAYRRVGHSKKRLAELIERIEQMRRGQPIVASVKRYRSSPHQFGYPLSQGLDDLSPLISETVQPLIVALNYLVCALATARGRLVDESLQFPICNAPKHFWRRVPSELKGLGKEEVALIEKLQPYNGNDWLT